MRIWVTGLGVVSPLALTARATMDAMLAGRRALAEVTLFDPTGCRSRLAAEIPDLDVRSIAPAGEQDSWSRTDAMAVIAAREALGDLTGDVDLILGGTTAGMFETEDLLAEMHRDPTARRPLECMLCHPLSATVDRMRTAVCAFRRARTICSACSSGANALLLGASWLRTGRSDRVLAGGADGLCRLTYTGFSCLGALSPQPCLPFDANRQGLNLGEGAAFLLLETEAAARARGAEPIAELRGWAVAAEAHHITNPQASGEVAAAVMSAALQRAEIKPSDVDYINAHGTATPLNDQMEARAIHRAFGDAAATVGVSSTKSMIGHTLGAAGAIEAAICAMAIARGAMPPTVGLTTVDADCALDHVITARTKPIRATLSNSFGFGGSDACIVLAAVDTFDPPATPSSRRVVITGAATLGATGVRDHERALEHLEPGDAPAAGSITFEAGDHLDVARARRIDRAGRFAAATMGAAIAAAQLPEGDRTRVGAIMGAAYGSVDACSAFIHRVYEKGAKFASPAVFPNLLPSSPVAHASIYHQLQGPVFSSADLDATSEGAVVTAAELIAAGEADVMLAGGVEETSQIVEAVLEPVCSASGSRGARSEGTAVVVLEAASTAAARGAVVLARVAWHDDWRGPPRHPLANATAPVGRAAVVVAVDDDAVSDALRGSAWETVERRAAQPRAGAHECAGGFATVAGIALLHSGALDCVLVLGVAPDRGFAMVLGAANEDHA